MKTVGMIVYGPALVLAATAAHAQQPPQQQPEQPASGAATVQVEEKQPVGRYLTDAQGRSLYLFEADSKDTTTCYDDCAQAWPPVLTQGNPQAGEGIEKNMLGTIERQDGSQQVTYNGWPLYYFVKDKAPGDIEGQDVEGFGAEWYLVTPQGEVARAEGKEKKRG